MTTKSKYAKVWSIAALVILAIYLVVLAPFMFAGRTPTALQVALAVLAGAAVGLAAVVYGRRVVRG